MWVQLNARWKTYIATRALDKEKKLNVRVVPLLSCIVILLRHPLSRTDQHRYCWNNLDVSTSHMEHLAKDLLFSPVIPQTFPAEEVNPLMLCARASRRCQVS